MASDGSVSIDLLFPANKQTFRSDVELVNDLLKRLGEGTGQNMDDEFNKNINKLSDQSEKTSKKVKTDFDKPIKQEFDADTAKLTDAVKTAKDNSETLKKPVDVPIKGDSHQFDETVDESKSKLHKFPKAVTTKLVANAQKNGIENFGELLHRLPKKQQTELLAKADKGEAIDYEEVLKRIPERLLTSVELNDNASAKLQQIQGAAETTESKFGHLKEIIAGSFIGSALSQTFSVITSGMSDLSSQAIEASDSIFKFKSTMKFGGFGEDEIKKSSKEVKKYADDTVYDLGDVSNTTAQLAANGIKNYMKLTESAGNLNAAAGGNADTFKSVAMMLTQTAGAGKLTTENWNQLTDAIPGASGKLQKAMKDNGAYTGNFRDAMAAGKISSKEFSKAIMELGQQDGAKKAAKSTKTFEGAVGNMQAGIVSKMKDIIDAFGKDKLTDAISGFGDGVSAALGQVEKFVKYLQKNKSSIEKYAPIFKGLLASIMAFTAIVTVTWAAEKLGSAFKVLFGVISDNPFALTVAVIVGIGVALYEAYKHVKPFRDAVNGLWDTMKKLFTGKLGWEKAITKEFNSIVKGFNSWKKSFKKGWSDFWSGLGDTFSDIGKAISNFGKSASKKFSSIWKGITKVAKVAWDGLKKLAGIAFKAIAIVALAPLIVLAASIIKTWEIIKKPTLAAWKLIKKYIVEPIKGAYHDVVDWVTKIWKDMVKIGNHIAKQWNAIWSGIADFFGDIWKQIKRKASAGWDYVKDGVSAAWKWVSKQFHNIWDPIASFFSSVWAKIKRIASAGWNFIKNGVEDAWDAVSKKWRSVWNSIKSFFSNAWSGIKSLAHKGWTFIRDGVSDAWDTVSDKWKKVWGGIRDFFSDIWTDIKKHARNGINGVITWLNKGIKGIDSIIHSFGGKKRAIALIPTFATGTTGAPKGPAVVNDGNGEEAIIDRQQNVHVLHGQNRLVQFEGGETVIPYEASASMYGGMVRHFAGGTNNWTSKLGSWFKDKWDGLVEFIKHPIKSLERIMTTAIDGVTSGTSDLVGNLTPALGKGLINGIEAPFKKLLSGLKTKHEADDTGSSSSTSAKPSGGHMNWLKQAGFPASSFGFINYIVNHESGWNPHATNPSSGAYGLPQSLPASKLASAGKDWRDNPITQLKWMKSYINSRYGGPAGAQAFWAKNHWYADGGITDQPSIFGEAGLESAVPLSAAKADRGYEMLGKSAAYMAARDGLNTNSGFDAKAVMAAVKQGLNGVSGDLQVNVDLDSGAIANATYPKIKAMQAQQLTVVGRGGSIPVGGF